MSKMRVLALTTSYPLHAGGSAGVFVQSLYRALSPECAIEVVCPAGLERQPATCDDAGADIRIHAVRYAPRRWRVLAQQSGGVVSALRRAPWCALLLPVMLGGLFWRCLRDAGHADLIHANWAICGVLAGLAGRLRGKPVIVTLRGSDVTRAARSRLDRVILRLAVQNSRRVVCVSQAMAEHLRAQFPERAADIHVGLNGVDERFFGVQRIPATVGNRLRVLAVGNLIHLKGFDVLIEAVARARGRNQMQVNIVGDGPDRDALSTLASRRGVAGRITFAGRVPVAGMPLHYAAADVLVLASRSEGRPNVVVEALAAGLPVISTNLEGVSGMVTDGDTGWLVAVDDADAMAAALDQAASDRAELQRRGQRARAFARAHIDTWADAARGYAAIFRSVHAPQAGRFPSCAE